MRRDGGRCFLPGLWPPPSPVPPSSPLPQNGGMLVLICHRWVTPNARALLLALRSTRHFNMNLQQTDGVPRCSQGVLLDVDMCRAFWGHHSHHLHWLQPTEQGMRCWMPVGVQDVTVPHPTALPPPWSPSPATTSHLAPCHEQLGICAPPAIP